MIYQTYRWGGGVYSKSEVDTLLTDYIPKSGTNALSGSIVPSTNETVNLGSLNNIYNVTYSNRFSSGSDISSYMALYSGNDYWGDGSALILYAKDCTLDNMSGGEFVLAAVNGLGWHRLIGYPNGTLIWEGQPIQYASDRRLKQQISKIDNALLDAWEDVEPVQFKYNDAVEQKGKDNARLHTGYVVQQINEACQKHNIDISEYGLYCHEEYPERTEEVTITNEDGTTSKETKVIEEASEHYSLRYTETLVVECAYLRRENARLKERLQQHEDYFSNIEKRLQSLENS